MCVCVCVCVCCVYNYVVYTCVYILTGCVFICFWFRDSYLSF